MKIYFFYFEAIIVWMTSDRNCKILFFILFSLYLLSSELRITHLLRTKFEVKTKKGFFVFSLSSFLFLFCNFFWETEVMRLSTWKIHFLWNVFFIWKVKTAKWHAKRCRQTDRQTDRQCADKNVSFARRHNLLFAEISNL